MALFFAGTRPHRTAGLVLADRGSHRLKGVEGDWQLFAISPGPDRR
jgi:hypothetical protein